MTHIASHIRIFSADPSDDLVEKRTDAIGEIAKVFKGTEDVSDLLQIANDLAVAVQQGGTLSAALTTTIEGAIRKKSTAFVADKRDLEMLVCGLSAVLQNLSSSSALSHGRLSRSDVLAFGFWSALSFQKPRTELKLEQLRLELLQAAQAHCAAVARAGRQRISVPDPDFKRAAKQKEGEPEAALDAPALSEGLKPFKNAIADLRSNAAIDREEIDLLWWLVSDWSSLLNRRFSDEEGTNASAAVASGLEVGRMIRRVPGDAHRHLVLRHVRGDGDLSLKELLVAVDADNKALAPTESQTYIEQCPAIFPLLAAFKGGAPADQRAKIKRSLSEWATRALLESSIVHLCSQTSGVSI